MTVLVLCWNHFTAHLQSFFWSFSIFASFVLIFPAWLDHEVLFSRKNFSDAFSEFFDVKVVIWCICNIRHWATGFWHWIFMLLLLLHGHHPFFFFLDFTYLFSEKVEKREKERERNINVWLPLAHPLTCNSGMFNQTSDPLVHRPPLNPLSHTS